MQPAPPHLAQIGALPFVERAVFTLGFGEQVADLRRGEMLMGDATQSRELLRPSCGPACRHHGRGIPMEHRDRSLDRSKPAKLRF